MSQTRERPSDPPPTVVIVDDEPRFREMLAEVLEADGAFRIVGEASCGQDALDIVIDLDAEIVIVDVQMPGSNGFETTRLLLELRSDLQVVVTSGMGEAAYHRLCTEVGAVGFLEKRDLSGTSLGALLSSAR